MACVDEVELLTAFWDVAKHYETIVTFNGRGFDVPFIYLRSALLNVPITRKDWLGYRFQTEPHCDLAEQLTFYGVSGRRGRRGGSTSTSTARRSASNRPRARGDGHGYECAGGVGRYREIAEYCLRDVKATVLLYHIWKERLAGIK